jgi:hypothetical protein
VYSHHQQAPKVKLGYTCRALITGSLLDIIGSCRLVWGVIGPSNTEAGTWGPDEDQPNEGMLSDTGDDSSCRRPSSLSDREGMESQEL